MGRTAREVLNELKWRERSEFARAEIWVADRTLPEGGRILSGAEIVSIGRKYFSTATATIPLYKIVRIVVDGTIRFDRPPPHRAA